MKDSALNRVGGRVTAFAVVAVGCVSVAAVYVDHAAERDSRADDPRPGRAAAPPSTGAPGATDLAELGAAAGSRLLALRTAEGADHGRLTSLVLDQPGNTQGTDLRCDRVDVAGGRGVCLVSDGHSDRSAVIFDTEGPIGPIGPSGPSERGIQSFRPLGEIPIEGLPSRVRVAPNGRVAAATSFVAGDSYAVDSFSTRTVFLDLDAGEVIADMERFDLRRRGRAFHPIDMNFWG